MYLKPKLVVEEAILCVIDLTYFEGSLSNPDSVSMFRNHDLFNAQRLKDNQNSYVF